MFSKSSVVSFGLLTVSAVAAPASASHVDMTFLGSGKHSTVTVWHTGFVSAANPTGTARVAAGQNLWSISPGGSLGGGASERQLFSYELGAPVSGTAFVLSIHEVVDPGPSSGRAEILRNLYSTAFQRSMLSDAHAAAFQVAIWEVVHEGAFNSASTTFNGSGLDAANGNVELGGFAIGNGRTGTRDPIASLANEWLSEAWHRWFNGESGQILSVTNGGIGAGQIMDSPVIPLPSASALALAGLLGLGATRRRRV
jgi:hypothetical protein